MLHCSILQQLSHRHESCNLPVGHIRMPSKGGMKVIQQFQQPPTRSYRRAPAGSGKAFEVGEPYNRLDFRERSN